MHLYVIYDEGSGEIVQTHAKYVLGDDEPVACTDEEVLAAADPSHAGEGHLRVAQVPEGFDPHDRSMKITWDPETGKLQEVKRRRPRARAKKR